MENQQLLNHLGSILKKARKDFGYSQEYVAITIHSNITRISLIENGKVTPDILEILNLTRLLKLDMTSLFPAENHLTAYYNEESVTIVNGINELDRLLHMNQSTILRRWFKTISTEIQEIMKEVQFLGKS